MTLARDGKAVARDGKALARDGKALARDGKALARDGKAVARDGKALARDGKALARDGKAVARDGKALARDGTERGPRRPTPGGVLRTPPDRGRRVETAWGELRSPRRSQRLVAGAPPFVRNAPAGLQMDPCGPFDEGRPMSNSINLAALGFGGIDTSSLVSSLVALQQQPIQQLQQQQANIQAASASISSFSSTLSALKSATVELSDPLTFGAMKATSSSSAVVSTASGDPQAGEWSVSVGALAQEQRTMSNGIASTSTALGLSGTLGISLGNGTSAQVTLKSTDTLEDVATAISSAGLRVQAGVMYDGSQYHLMISGQDTGASSAITFDESSLTASSGFSLGLATSTNTIQKAQDAQLTVGGVAITSGTNQVANAIPGVTLALTQGTTSPATVTIAGDSSALESQVQAFVTAYNNVVTSGHTTAGYGTQAASSALLQGDSAVRSSLDQLGQIVGEQVPGSSGAYTTLGSVGISLNTDGTLTLDSGTFSAALQADPASVQRLFVTDSSNGSTGIMGQLGSALDAITNPSSGALQAEVNGFQQRSTRLGTEISNGEQRSTQYQTQLQNEFSQMNTMLEQYKQISSSLNANNNNSNNNTAL